MEHRRPPRTARQWLRDDLHGLVGPRTAARLLRRHPALLVRWALCLVAAYVLAAAALSIVGQLALLSRFGYVPGMLASAPFGVRLSRLRDEAEPKLDG